MKVSIYGPNLPSSAGADFLVHRTGCADTEKRFYRALGADQGGWTAEVDSIEDTVREVYCDIIAGDPETYPEPDGWEYLVGEFKFFGCTESLPYKTAAKEVTG